MEVAILEDNKQVGDLLTSVLIKTNYQPILFKTGEEAIKAYRGAEKIPMIFLVDYDLPDSKGTDVIQALELLNKNCLIIGMSATDDKKVMLEFLNTGCQKVIKKLDDKTTEEGITKIINIMDRMQKRRSSKE